MKDFLGREIQIGDTVVYHTAGRRGKMQKCVVEGFTPKMVRLLPEKKKPWANYINAYSSSMIVVTQQEMSNEIDRNVGSGV